MYATDHAVFRQKFRLWDSSNVPYARPGRITRELKKLSAPTIVVIAASDLGVPAAVQTKK
jgi:hypothetical protein